MRPSVTVAGVTIPHNTSPWRVCTNRHPETSGRSWGWIEGAPGNVCWSDNAGNPFGRSEAGQAVAAHNEWLEQQRPVEHRLAEAYAQLDRVLTDVAKAQETLRSAEHMRNQLLEKINALEKP